MLIGNIKRYRAMLIRFCFGVLLAATIPLVSAQPVDFKKMLEQGDFNPPIEESRRQQWEATRAQNQERFKADAIALWLGVRPALSEQEIQMMNDYLLEPDSYQLLKLRVPQENQLFLPDFIDEIATQNTIRLNTVLNRLPSLERGEFYSVNGIVSGGEIPIAGQYIVAGGSAWSFDMDSNTAASNLAQMIKTISAPDTESRSRLITEEWKEPPKLAEAVIYKVVSANEASPLVGLPEYEDKQQFKNNLASKEVKAVYSAGAAFKVVEAKMHLLASGEFNNRLFYEITLQEVDAVPINAVMFDYKYTSRLLPTQFADIPAELRANLSEYRELDEQDRDLLPEYSEPDVDAPPEYSEQDPHRSDMPPPYYSPDDYLPPEYNDTTGQESDSEYEDAIDDEQESSDSEYEDAIGVTDGIE